VKLYISADMEGTAGVCAWQQCDPSNTHEYPVYRRLMSREVRAAIDGARAAGVTDVLLNDAHWSMTNLLFDELPDEPWLRVISGTPKPRSMGERLDGSFGGAFFTGFHAGAGEIGTLSHTSSPETIARVSVNGVACSEMLLYAALAGSYGVPVLLVTGDRTIVDEAAQALPWATGVAVKEPIGYNAIDSLTPVAAQSAIRSGAREAVASAERAQPFVFEPPCELLIETAGVEHADFIELLPRFERIGGRALRFTGTSYIETLEAFIVATRLGSRANAAA
jgi:D-amino peptidase